MCVKMVWIFTVFLLIFERTCAINEYCPLSWEQWEDKCLHMTDKLEDPINANHDCKESGGEPLVITDANQNQFFTEKFPLGDEDLLTLGCRNMGSDRRWKCHGEDPDSWYWFNASSNAGYWNWAPGQPDYESYLSCLFLHANGSWVDLPCDDKRNMIIPCVQELVSTPVKCPMSWEPLDNKCVFLLSDYVAAPSTVEEICASQGKNVFVVDSPQQNTYLTGKVQASESKYVMLGCADNGNNEGIWSCAGRSQYLKYWGNGTTVGYWNWDEGEPGDYDPSKDFLYLNSNGAWTVRRGDTEEQMLVACEDAPTNVDCLPDYEPWEDKCLHVQSFNGNSTSAMKACQNMYGGSLVVIETESQDFFLKLQVTNLTETDIVFLGCSDQKTEGTWLCDGKDETTWFWKSATDNQGYWKWHPDEPKNDNKSNCLGMDHEGYFKAVPCEISSNFLACTRHEGLIVPTTVPTMAPTTVPGTTGISSTSIETTAKMTTKASTTDGITTLSSSTMHSITLTTEGPQPHPMSGLKEGAIVGIIISILAFVALACFLGYACTHPASSAGRCLSQAFGRGKYGSNIPYNRTPSESDLLSNPI